MKRTILYGAALLFATFTVVGCGGQQSSETTSTAADTTTMANETMAMEDEPQEDIPTLAMNNPDLSTLVSALQAADLVATLQSDGPFTVFAPTNAAFEALPAGTLEDLLKPENKEKLASILKYHVVSGEVMSSDLQDGQTAPTVEGSNITVKLDGQNAMINDARVVAADVEASNGVVHVIDKVIMPEAKQNM